MNDARFDAGTPSKDSTPPAPIKRSGIKPKLTPTQRRQHDLAIEGREFVSAVMVYPIGCEFNLWNLQGDMGIRLSCTRRGRVSAEIDFAREIRLAKDFGWLRELAEDEQFTRECQEEYENSAIRYGATFVRTRLSRSMRSQVDRFCVELAEGSLESDG